MLGLLALVGITFATYAGQSRINNRNFMQSLFQPQADELIDFGLAQLITDTNDIRSAIRGHSLARDMYGNDATGNALLVVQPDARGWRFQITGVARRSGAGPNQYTLTTNIQSNDHCVSSGTTSRDGSCGSATRGAIDGGGNGVVDQTFEILADSRYNANSTTGRTFLVTSD